jgi:hypothetical protein
MLVICPIFDRCDLLSYYLRYYTRLGATQFVIALWNGDRNPLYEVLQSYAANWPVQIRTSIVCPVKDYNGPDESNGLNRIREEFQPRFQWYCLADLDEFCWFNGMTMPEITAAADKGGFTAVHGYFFDRFARAGYPPVPVNGSLDETFPMVCEATQRLGANYNKIPLSRSHVAVESGHHYTKGHACQANVEVHHFKWTEGLVGRLRERDMYFTAQGLPWSGESRRFLQAVEDDDFRTNPVYNWREARKLGI